MTGGKYNPDATQKKWSSTGNPYYNPNDYINISPAEIERQHKLNMEIMKAETKWRSENLEANKLPVESK